MVLTNARIYARVSISREMIEAARAEENGWRQGLLRLGLRPVQILKYERRARSSRFVRRTLLPELAGVAADLARRSLNEPNPLLSLLAH